MTNKTLMKIMGFCAAVAGVLVFIMMFLTAVTTGGDNPSTLTGAQLAFGAQTFDFGVIKGKVLFSFGVTLAYLLPIASVILMLLCVLGKKNSIKFILGCVAFGCFVTSVVLLACSRNMATYETTLSFWGSSTSGQGHFEGYNMGIGLILAIVFASVGALTSGTYTCLQLLKSSKKSSKRR